MFSGYFLACQKRNIKHLIGLKFSAQFCGPSGLYLKTQTKNIVLRNFLCELLMLYYLSSAIEILPSLGFSFPFFELWAKLKTSGFSAN